MLPYPPQSLGPEIVAVFFFIIISWIRLYLGTIIFKIASIGNKTETSIHLLYAIFLAAPVAFGYIYYLRLQTYVLIFDLVLNAIGLGFIAFEVILSLFAIFNIKAHEKTV